MSKTPHNLWGWDSRGSLRRRKRWSHPRPGRSPSWTRGRFSGWCSRWTWWGRGPSCRLGAQLENNNRKGQCHFKNFFHLKTRGHNEELVLACSFLKKAVVCLASSPCCALKVGWVFGGAKEKAFFMPDSSHCYCGLDAIDEYCKSLSGPEILFFSVFSGWRENFQNINKLVYVHRIRLIQRLCVLMARRWKISILKEILYTCEGQIANGWPKWSLPAITKLQ